MSIPAGSLKLHYDFSDPTCYPGTGNTIYDISGNGVNATNTNAVFKSNGNGSYFDFNGINAVITSASYNQTSKTVMTYNCWSQYSSTALGYMFITGLGILGPSGGGSPVFAVNEGNINEYRFNFGYGYGAVTAPSIQNQWTMVTITADGTTVKFYINGVLVTSASQGVGQIDSGAQQTRLGAFDTGGGFFTGRIATFEYYNAALSSGDILALYNNTKSRFPLNSYDFSNSLTYSGSGNTVYDLAGNLELPINNASFVSNGLQSYFNFNGTNAYIGKNGITGLGNTFSFSFWSKYPASATSTMFPYSAGVYNGNGGGPQSAIASNAIDISFNNGIGATSFSTTPDVWHLYTFTADGTTVKGYLDGVLQGSASQGVGTWSTGGLYLGVPINSGGAYYPGFYYNGQIATFDIYNVALGSTDVTNIYNAQSYRFDNLIASYDLNNLSSYPGTGNTLYDVSGNNFDITLNATSYVDSTNYNSLVFTQSSGSTAVYNGSLGIPTSTPTFTFFMWIKTTSFVQDYDIFFSYGRNGNPGIGGIPLICSRYNNVNVAYTEFGSGVAPIAPGTTTVLNEWTNYCITCDGTTYKFYIDGTLVGSVAKGSGAIFTPEKLSIGSFDGGGYGCNLEFNLLNAYNVALSDSEITSLYNNTVTRFAPAPPTTALIGSYDFSDPTCWPGSGNTVYDLTAEGNDLSITSTTFGGTGQSKYAIFDGDTTYLYRSQFSASGTTFSGGNFTLNLWHNYTNNQQNNAAMIMGGNGGYAQGIQLQVNGSDSNKITAAFGIEFTEGGQLVGIANTTNTWNMSTVTGDGTTLKLYQNGALIGSTSQLGTWDGRAFIIGRGLGASNQPSPVGPGFRYAGLIGIAEVYSAALGSTAISDLYALQQPRFYPDTLITEIDFINPACFTNGGTAVTDLSIYNNNWTLASNSYTYNGTIGSLALPANNNLLSDNTSILGTGVVSWTISFWHFATNQSESIFYNGCYPTGYIGPQSYWNAGTNTLIYRVNTETGPVDTGSITLDTWHLFTIEYDTINLKIYIDGVLEATATKNIDLVPSITYPGMQFMNIYDNTGISPIALINMYDAAIGSTAITALYNNQVTRFNPQPVYDGKVGGRQFQQGFNG